MPLRFSGLNFRKSLPLKPDAQARDSPRFSLACAFRSCTLTTGLAPVEACLLARKRKTSLNRHRGACLRGALFRSAKTAPDRQHCSIGPGRGVDTNVMAPFWLINTRPRGQAPVVRKVRNFKLAWRPMLLPMPHQNAQATVVTAASRRGVAVRRRHH